MESKEEYYIPFYQDWRCEEYKNSWYGGRGGEGEGEVE